MIKKQGNHWRSALPKESRSVLFGELDALFDQLERSLETVDGRQVREL
jgi:hypothetical protein